MSEFVSQRKPVLGKRNTGKFVQQEFQTEDLGFLAELEASANWSEMGAMKTTTAEWLWAQKLKHIPNPRVLVITTKSGKGTYFESLSEVLPDWDVFTVNISGAKLVLNGRIVPFVTRLPNPLHFRPVVVVAHYHCFTNRACTPRQIMQMVTAEDGTEHKVPILQEDGTFKMEIPFCNTLMSNEWDMVVLDEAHRIKNHDAQWTRNIKKIKSRYRHVMTGTGFVNNPSEIWSLLNFLYPKTYTSYWKFYDRYCNTPDAPIWMSDLTFKQLGDIVVGDKIVGWDTENTPTSRWENQGERKLRESEVLAINRRTAPVVKVTMKSGCEIKCTPDHLWLSGRGKGSIDRFIDVMGMRTGVNEVPQLVRIVDPPRELTDENEIRTAAYLGGIMDGEGTYPVIAQSPSYNPETHLKIRESLNELGFYWNYAAMKSKIRIGGGQQGERSLEANFKCRQAAVNFLNWCKPAKTDRIIKSVLGKGRWRLSDEIVSIESLGEQEVVSMKTSTGNYVAWGYASKNCDWDDFSGYKKVTGINPRTEQEFKELVRRVGVRRNMLECFPDIPEPIETVVPVSLNKIQQTMYDEIKEELYTMDQSGTPLHSPNVLSMLNRLRQIAVATPEVLEDYYDAREQRRIIKIKLIEPSSKLDAAMDIIEGLEWDAERKDQIVVFSFFRDPIGLLKDRLTKKGISFLHLHAGLSEKDTYEMWHETWPEGKHQVFLSTLGKGAESINLTAAHRCIFLDQSWSPVQNNQAIGRVYRPGQKHPAQLIYIRAEETVDYRILATNQEKNSWFKTIFGDGKEDDET